MLRIGLECKVFCYDGMDGHVADVGVDIPLSECVLKDFTFYSVDYITICSEDSSYVTVGSCGDNFVVNETYKSFKERFEMIRVLDFN